MCLCVCVCTCMRTPWGSVSVIKASVRNGVQGCGRLPQSSLLMDQFHPQLFLANTVTFVVTLINVPKINNYKYIVTHTLNYPLTNNMSFCHRHTFSLIFLSPFMTFPLLSLFLSSHFISFFLLLLFFTCYSCT